MDIARKLELVEQQIRSISRHDDEDMAVRGAALARIEALIRAERDVMSARVEERIAAAIGQPPAP